MRNAPWQKHIGSSMPTTGLLIHAMEDTFLTKRFRTLNSTIFYLRSTVFLHFILNFENELSVLRIRKKIPTVCKYVPRRALLVHMVTEKDCVTSKNTSFNEDDKQTTCTGQLVTIGNSIGQYPLTMKIRSSF